MNFLRNKLEEGIVDQCARSDCCENSPDEEDNMDQYLSWRGKMSKYLDNNIVGSDIDDDVKYTAYYFALIVKLRMTASLAER